MNSFIDKIVMGIKSIGIILLIIVFPSLFMMIFNINGDASDKGYVFYYTLAEVVLACLMFIIYRKDVIRDFKNFKKDINGNLELAFRYWAVGFCIMIVSNLFITFILEKSLAGNEKAVRSFIDTAPIMMFISTVFCAPFNEELAFRKSIRDVISNKWVYALVSGLVFGGLHIVSYISSVSDLIYLIPYGSLGFVFALLYYKSNNIFSSMSMHMFHNLLSVLTYLLGAALI